MLTYPSDSLPQIVCPMDEDAYPPNPFCSAPPHSETPPPLLSLSSITPSCANDGIPGHRRSGRIQGVRAQTPKKQSNTDSKAAQKPSRQNPSPNKRQKEGSMVQVSQSKQPRVESTDEHAKQDEDGFDFGFTTEHQNNQKDQKRPWKKTNVSSAENIAEQSVDNAQNDTDATKSDLDKCKEADTLLENASAPTGWVIGPLFQSFKSKMASFTEIVMSPVKLFRANSPPLSIHHSEKLSECEQPADGPSDVEHSEPTSAFNPDGLSETRNLEAEANQQGLGDAENAQNTKTVNIKYCKKLLFAGELSTHSSEQANECAVTLKETNCLDSVPLHHSPLPCFASENIAASVWPATGSPMLLETSVNVGASHESKLEISSAIKAQKDKEAALLKPVPRELKRVASKCVTSDFRGENSDLQAGDSSDITKTVPLSSSDCYNQCDTDCVQLDGDESGTKIESCRLIRQSLRNNLNKSANGRKTKPSTAIQQLEYSAAGLGRAKRGPKQQCYSQDLVKRKKLTGGICTDDTKKQGLLNVASDSSILRGPTRREEVSTSTIIDTEETLKPARKKAVSTRGNRKGKGGQEILPTINEAVLKTESSSDAKLVCSLNITSDVSENNQKVCSSSGARMKPSASCKRLKTRPGLGKADISIDDSMDLETTVAISSMKPVEEELLTDVFVRPDIKHLSSKSSNTNKRPPKRKSPVHSSSVTESDSTWISASSILSMEASERMAADLNISLPVQREDNLETRLNQPSKRPKKGVRGAFKSSEVGGAQEIKQCISDINVKTKESQSQEGKSIIPVDPIYFEMTPFESNHQHAHSSSQSHPSCSGLLNNVVGEKEKSPVSVADEVFPADISVSRLRSSSRKVTTKPRRLDNQSRKCRILHSRSRKGKEVTNSVTMEDTNLTTTPTCPSEKGFSRRLLRSYSCPEIPSLCSHDTPWAASLHLPHHNRTPTSHQHHSSYTPHVTHARKSVQRARRHTVCSIEVEREIAPLCLRKEVYPSRRSVLYDSITHHLSPTLALSPSNTLSALASCFLSSPLAFLSKKVDSRGSAASPSTSTHVSSPTSSSSTYPLTSSTWHLPGFLQSADSTHVTLDSSSSRDPLECEPERRQQCEEEEYGEDTSSSSQEYEDVGLREEKALSDSEIKAVEKHEERRKVSSIRIRKTLPKPQNNLTPMGLPKPIRLKKKEFSLEEIYTNKNFSKPPESRLETIFEVPLSRRNGSESWFGQKRVKRFLEFLEVGEARKPKKPLVGVGKTAVSSSRTRRGGFTKDEPSLTVQDVDSLLCAKLDELNLWLIHDQNS